MKEKRIIPLGIKNAHPELYGYANPRLIPGNEDGIAVPCAPFEIDTDKRWLPLDTFEEAYFWRNEYRKEQAEKDMETRCIIPGNFIVPPDGTRGNFKVDVKGKGKKYSEKKCTYHDCNYCPYLWNPEYPDQQVPYKRTGGTISLDFEYDPSDPEESEHDIADPDCVTPEEQYIRDERHKALLDLLNQQDETDRRIIDVLLNNEGISDCGVARVLKDVPKNTVVYRHNRLKKLIEEFLKNF